MSKDDFMPCVEYSPEIMEQMKEDPELSKFMRDFSSMARQAMQAVHDGQYETFDEAMEAITGHKPEQVDLDEFDEG